MSKYTPEERAKMERRKKRREAYGLTKKERKQLRDAAYSYDRANLPVDYVRGDARPRQPKSWEAGKKTGLQRNPEYGTVETFKLPKVRQASFETPVAAQAILNTGEYIPPELASKGVLAGNWMQMAHKADNLARAKRKMYDEMKEQEKEEYRVKPQ